MSDFPEKSVTKVFNVISVTRGWVGVQFPGKYRYVTLEWPQSAELESNKTGQVRIKDKLCYFCCGQ